MAKKVTAKNPLGSGANLKEINWDMVDIMLIKGCDGTLIAHRMGIHPDTLYARGYTEKRWGAGTKYSDFSAYKQHKRKIGDESLLERQYDTAMGIWDSETKSFKVHPDKTMLIWLGKQRCGQSDRTDITSGDEAIKTVAPIITIIEQH